jgi:hypothetical protein
MKPIPPKLRQEMDSDPWYHRCAITGNFFAIEWHHVKVNGRQYSEKFCIIPLSKKIHDRAYERAVKERLEWIMVCRASPEEIKRHRLEQMAGYLTKKYGRYDQAARYKI